MLAVHLKQGRERTIITKSAVEKGMVIFFRYRKKDGTSSTYVATVLNPNYLGKMHALSMNEIVYPNYIKFAERFGIRFIPKFQKFRGVDLPKLDMSISSRRIYEGIIKKELEMAGNKLNNSYRTFTIEGLSSIQLLNYDFGPKLNRQLET